jgi:streptomycin 6-kinase
VSAPQRGIAVDSAAVLAITGDMIGRYSGSIPVSATVQVLRDVPLRVVARYEVALADGTTAVLVGKWYAGDRGAVVASELEYLSGIGLPVAPLLGYWPDVRLLLTAWVPGQMLTRLLAARTDTARAVARAAGCWAARLHGSDMPTPRSCGPAKQRASLAQWRATSAEVADLSDRVARALTGYGDPNRPVHYDHHHEQVVESHGGAIVLDLDEAGRGDPAFDVAHFLAHLELLGLQHHRDPAAYNDAAAQYRAGYAEMATWPGDHGILAAFAWCKLAQRLIHRNAPAREIDYALAAGARALGDS